LINGKTIAPHSTCPLRPGDQIGPSIGGHWRIDDAQDGVSVIEKGDGDRTPAKPSQKVPGAVVRVNDPAGALLLRRRVRGAGQYAELFANESCGPGG
jgi:hypothetical protein